MVSFPLCLIIITMSILFLLLKTSVLNNNRTSVLLSSSINVLVPVISNLPTRAYGIRGVS